MIKGKLKSVTRKEKRQKWIEKNPEWLKNYRLENKEILSKRSTEWNKNHPEIAKKRQKNWVSRNKDKVSKLNKAHRERNKEKYLKKKRENEKRRFKENPLSRFSHNIRCLVNSSFKRSNKGFKKSNKTEDILGCSIEYFTQYILSMCPNGTKFEDFGRYGYHLDHIIPISVASSAEEILKLNHYTNFQPLWWKENLSKSSKLII